MSLPVGTSAGTIYLNDVAYPCDLIQYTELATLLGKVTLGDFTRDSDDIMSSKIWASWAGGMQVLNHREGADEGRYWAGFANTVYPNQMGPLRKIRYYAAMEYPLGDIGGSFYAANTDRQIKAWNEGSKTFGSTVATLTSVPVHRGVAFKGKLYIPQSVGYQSFDGTTLDAQNTTVKAIGFALWDTKLFAITSDNKLYSTSDGSTWTLEFTLDSSSTMRRIVLWMDANSEPALYVATTRGIYGWDDLAAKLVPTRMMVPPHPDNGYGFCMWRSGEDLFYSAGMDIARFTGAAISPQMSGLSRDEGLPAEWRGVIKDLIPGYNAMYALVEGTINTVFQFNGFGWHPVYSRPIDDTPVIPAVPAQARWLVLSDVNSTTRLWWGGNETGYTVELDRHALNLREQINSGSDDFETYMDIDLGWFDAGMRMFDKIASHAEINFSNLTVSDILLKYLKDNETTWTTLIETPPSPVGENVRRVYPFGVAATSDGLDFSYGTPFRRIRLRVTGTRTYDDSRSIIAIDSIVLKFIKRPQQVTSFTFTIPIPNQGFLGRSAQELRDELRAYSTSPQMVRLRLGDSTYSYRVYLSRNYGTEPTGEADEGFTNFTVIHLPLDTWEGTQTHTWG